MPYTPNTTWVDGSGGGTPLSAARLNNLESGVTITYDAYTPALTASGGGSPTVGNGTVVGRYMQRGKLVHCYGRLTLGTTTNFGTGNLQVSLPVNASSNNYLLGYGEAQDVSVNAGWQVSIVYNAAGTFILIGTLTFLGTRAILSGSSAFPWAWATGDSFSWNITYEAA